MHLRTHIVEIDKKIVRSLSKFLIRKVYQNNLAESFSKYSLGNLDKTPGMHTNIF